MIRMTGAIAYDMGRRRGPLGGASMSATSRYAAMITARRSTSTRCVTAKRLGGSLFRSKSTKRDRGRQGNNKEGNNRCRGRRRREAQFIMKREDACLIKGRRLSDPNPRNTQSKESSSSTGFLTLANAKAMDIA